MTVLITGGTGFVGANVVSEFTRQGHDVVCYDIAPKDLPKLNGREVGGKVKVLRGDVHDLPHLSATVKEFSVEGIVHAAYTLSEPLMRDFPLTVAIKGNVECMANVLETARLGDLKVAFISSVGVYSPEADIQPLVLRTLHEDDPKRPQRLYGVTKLMCETLTTAYNTVYGLDTISVRLSAIYGPPSTTPGPGSIIYYFLENALKGSPIEWPRGGDQPIEFDYMRDVAHGIFLAYSVRPITHRVFNLGGGKQFTIREAGETVSGVVPGSSIRIGPGYLRPPWTGIPLEFVKHYGAVPDVFLKGPCETTRAREELKYQPRYDLEAGIRDFAEWLKNRSSQ